MDVDFAEHDHGRYRHAHAWATQPHHHMLRAVCHRPECAGAETHNIHAAPADHRAE